jgi:hypothetical protein
MLAAVAPSPTPLKGAARPRLAPPEPMRSDVAGYRKVAKELGIQLMPWQVTAARYLEATAPGGRHLYREVGIEVARQNGKTAELIPLIVKRLRAGRRIMHTAQDRDRPREVFAEVADIVSRDETLFRERNGRRVRPRFANGQEEIQFANGGRYKIVAPTRSGARGGTNDDVIIDEVRELDTFEFIGAAKPTLTTSRDPQIVYLSNAGDESSIVLNSIRERSGKDPRLAYLSWSAGPDRAVDDRRGWIEANPAVGHMPAMLGYLEDEYLSNSLAGTLSIFETEHLCRSVASMRERLIAVAAWAGCEATDLGAPVRPVLGISLDPEGHRASAAIAWKMADGKLALRLLFDVTGDPIDTDRLGADIRDRARALGVITTGYDPLTDAVLAKFFRRSEAVASSKFANASARFVAAIDSKTLRWEDATAVGDDLAWTARKPHDESGSFQAVRASDERPITAALAAIRAVWLASTPTPELAKARPTVMGF